MRITHRAAIAILSIMKNKKLDPSKFVLEIMVPNSGFGIGLGFSKGESNGKRHQFGELAVIVDPNLDTHDLVIDFDEINGKKGIIFLGEKNVS